MANSFESLKYVVTMETASSDEEAIAAFASWLDADAFLDHKVEEEKQFNDCYLDPAEPDQRNTYRIRKPL